MSSLTLSFASRDSIVANNALAKFLLSKLFKRIYNKASLSSLLDWTTRSFKATNRSNYEDLHRRSKSKDHTHIIRVLRALSIDDNLGLCSVKASKTLNLSIIESQFYKKTRRLSK